MIQGLYKYLQHLCRSSNFRYSRHLISLCKDEACDLISPIFGNRVKSSEFRTVKICCVIVHLKKLGIIEKSFIKA